jgi:hypothetical protein
MEVFTHSRSDQRLDLLHHHSAIGEERKLRLDRGHCPARLEAVPSQPLSAPRIHQALSGLGIEGWLPAIRDSLEVAIPVAAYHVHRRGLQPVPPGVLQDLVWAVETHGVGVDVRRGEGRRPMAFEPAAGVGQQGEAGRVGFGKALAAEPFDLPKDVRGVLSGISVREHARGELLPVRL